MSIRSRIANVGSILYMLLLVILLIAEIIVYILGYLQPMCLSEYIRNPTAPLEHRIVEGAWSAMGSEDLSRIPSYMGPILRNKCQYQYIGKYRTWIYEYVLVVVADSSSFAARNKGGFILDYKIRPISVFTPLILGVCIAVCVRFLIPISDARLIWERYRIRK